MLTIFSSIMVMDEALQAEQMTTRDVIIDMLIYSRYRKLILVLSVLICVILGLFPRDLLIERRP